MNLYLPDTVTINNKEYRIRTDFRVILEIMQALSDPDLGDSEKAECVITMFYIDQPDDFVEAIKQCYGFIDMGREDSKKKRPKIMDWEQDFDYIIAPVNRVLGKEARMIPYDYTTNEGGLHWWTFMSAYMEIGGDCLYSQIIQMRDKVARHKKLEKHEREWLNRNRDLVTIKTHYSERDDEMLQKFVGGVKNGKET